MENQKSIDWKQIGIFLGFSFGISWLTGLVIYLRGGLLESPDLIPNSGITEAFALLATGYMFAPAIGNAATRLITREGWENLWLPLRFKTGWPYWLAAWFGTPLLLAIGALIYFALFPQHLDANLEMVNSLLDASGESLPISPGAIVAIQIFQGILLSPILNLIPIFGEEFGWRAYLLPKLLPLGERKAYLLSGLIWGLWHAPVIAMGYNYGIEYPGAPWSGVLMFIWVCFVMGTFFGWATLRAKSVWPAVIGHAVLNGTAASVVLFTQEGANPLLGPSVVGIIGSVGFSLMTLLIFLRGIPTDEQTLFTKDE